MGIYYVWKKSFYACVTMHWENNVMTLINANFYEKGKNQQVGYIFVIVVIKDLCKL